MSSTDSPFVADYALQALGNPADLPFYSALLKSSLRAAPAPYGQEWFGKCYRDAALQPSFFASLLVSDAHLEGYSAGQLWGYADQIADEPFAQSMRLHATDEARHSRMFANLLFTIFPRLEDQEGLRGKLAAMAPALVRGGSAGRQAAPEEVLNTAILINLHEIKALILEALLRPLALAYAAPEQASRVAPLIDRLIQDEIRHISYTAFFIERAATQLGCQSYVEDAMHDFQVLLNESTLDEVERTSHLSKSLEEVGDKAAACTS